MQTITIQAPNNEIIEQIKSYVSTIKGVNIKDDLIDDGVEDIRTEKEMWQETAKGIKAIQEGKVKHRGFTNGKDLIEAIKKDI